MYMGAGKLHIITHKSDLGSSTLPMPCTYCTKIALLLHLIQMTDPVILVHNICGVM